MAKWVWNGTLSFNLIRWIQLCDKKHLTFIDSCEKKIMKVVLKNVIKLDKGSLKNILQDSFNKILSQKLTHDRSYISSMDVVCFQSRILRTKPHFHMNDVVYQFCIMLQNLCVTKHRKSFRRLLIIWKRSYLQNCYWILDTFHQVIDFDNEICCR